MTFTEYQQESRKTAIYPNQGKDHTYAAFGLVSEAGEVAGKAKRIIRDHNGQVTDDMKKQIADELGDVLWYLAQLATEFGQSLEDIAAANIAKLQSRQQRGVLHGSGDNR